MTAFTRHLARYRLFYRALFFLVLCLGMYLGMRPSPPPTPFKFNMVDSLYHAGGLFVCIILSYLAFPRLALVVPGSADIFRRGCYRVRTVLPPDPYGRHS